MANFSDADLATAKANPNFGMSMIDVWNDYAKAETPEQRSIIHSAAESLRKQYGNYSGGTDGSGYLTYGQTPQSYQSAAAPTYQNGYKDTQSSLLNALTGRNGLARTSNTPGRTQELNLFLVGEPPVLRLVDMPGYGYAEAPKDLVKQWARLVNDYLRGRPTLKRVLVLVDSRHGLKPGL